jgi:ribose transport system substrate-binding protein
MKHRSTAAVAVLVALAITIAGCSSSSKSSTTSSSNSGGGATSGASTSSGGGSSSASTGGGGLAAAQAATAKNLQAPTTIPATVPLKSKPPTGKTFVWMKCDVNQCVDEGNGLKAAAQALGWNYKELDYKSADPATLVSAMKQALQFKPTAVGLSGLPRAVWQSVIPAYQAAGVKIVTGYLGPTTYDSTVLGQVGAVSDVTEYGQMIGNWIVADSKGSAHILLETVNDFPILISYATGLKQVVAQNCPDCKVTSLNNTIAQVSSGGVVPTIIAALQKDKSIKYVSSVNGPFIEGLPSALAAAGLNDVQITGESGDVKNLSDVKAGKFAATTGLALHYGAWLMMDMVLRSMQGMTFDPDGDGGLPKQLLTKDGDFAISNSFDVPSDYADQFKKLWLLG